MSVVTIFPRASVRYDGPSAVEMIRPVCAPVTATTSPGTSVDQAGSPSLVKVSTLEAEASAKPCPSDSTVAMVAVGYMPRRMSEPRSL